MIFPFLSSLLERGCSVMSAQYSVLIAVPEVRVVLLLLYFCNVHLEHVSPVPSILLIRGDRIRFGCLGTVLAYCRVIYQDFASGIYIARLMTPGYSKSLKMLLLK
ncbi:MAG: hypothetical protein JSW54_08550 [Fidelibacterota bacterium]|nr:MAG: hypothetical protein JSW54_08550 [Candidatus Neomarinimicrobiota bacterium]